MKAAPGNTKIPKEHRQPLVARPAAVALSLGLLFLSLLTGNILFDPFFSFLIAIVHFLTDAAHFLGPPPATTSVMLYNKHACSLFIRFTSG